MAIVDVGDSSVQADSQPNWLVWSGVGSLLALFYNHQMNGVNSRNDITIIIMTAV